MDEQPAQFPDELGLDVTRVWIKAVGRWWSLLADDHVSALPSLLRPESAGANLIRYLVNFARLGISHVLPPTKIRAHVLHWNIQQRLVMRTRLLTIRFRKFVHHGEGKLLELFVFP